MSEVSSYAQGTPCWVDLNASDHEAAMEFYGGLFGWEYVADPAEFGHYTQAQRDGKPVAGIARRPAAENGEPPAVAWTPYLACDDAEVTLSAIRADGGEQITELMDVRPMGRVLVAMDPTGAVFGAWEAGLHIGAALVNEPGTVVWNELVTGDAPRARRFYSTVFGVRVGEPVPGSHDYTPFCVDDREVGGITTMGEKHPPGIPPHWRTYFAVTDPDATAAEATRRGGTVLRAPRDTPYGRTAALRDPQGAAFTVITAP
ncbi:VOC family protein [Streptomyces sp. SAJ15]|uniref:VOC family protein n=1 Tax=Streptomyces sp. SAJ15 TaxID=2011095 RepID=UPI001185A434|nr:VOC family protein [Streptomyces sp. SAJ15]TVL93721.1 glyoxalase [Streptomyces sp. SAJ15]